MRVPTNLIGESYFREGNIPSIPEEVELIYLHFISYQVFLNKKYSNENYSLYTISKKYHIIFNSVLYMNARIDTYHSTEIFLCNI